MRRKHGIVTAVLSVLALVVSLAAVPRAAEASEAASPAPGYTYTVRLYAGARGLLPGGEEVLTYTQNYNDRITFDQRFISQIQITDDKYYVKGIRLSGRDNDTVERNSFPVTADADYVVAYGIKGNMVSYTVNYRDAAGNTLAPSETYYGNVGDKPVVAYLYIDGYLPQYYNITATLRENASENEFNFVYNRVVTPTAAPAPTAAPTVAPQPTGTGTGGTGTGGTGTAGTGTGGTGTAGTGTGGTGTAGTGTAGTGTGGTGTEGTGGTGAEGTGGNGTEGTGGNGAEGTGGNGAEGTGGNGAEGTGGNGAEGTGEGGNQQPEEIRDNDVPQARPGTESSESGTESGTESVTPTVSPTPSPIGSRVPIGIIASIVAALAVAGGLIWFFLGKRRRDD